jgi:protein SCO1/2
MPPPGHAAGVARRGPAAPLLLIALTLLATVVGACGGSAPSTPGPVWVEAVTEPPIGTRDTAFDPARPAPALDLTDQDGRPFDLASLRSRPVFVYFGYTHCPDVCPTTLADLRAAIKAADVNATVVFVTVDPERDDVAAMKQYVDFYGMDFTGLTGTPDQIAQAAAAWGVTYRKLPSDSASGYAMAHSTDSYLVDAEGMLRHHVYFGAPTDLVVDLLHEVSGT